MNRTADRGPNCRDVHAVMRRCAIVGYAMLACATALLLPIENALAAPGDAPVLSSAASRKTHGAAGPFDLPLSLTLNNPTTEPRTGPAQTVVFIFDKPVTGGNASVTEGTAVAGAPTFNGTEMIVPLTGVANLQYVTVAVSNVAASDGGTGGSGSVRIGYLVGDISANRVVSLSDLAQVNAQIAQRVTGANFVKDVNASGTLSVADKGITNAQVTKALPAVPPPAELPPDPSTVAPPLNPTVGTNLINATSFLYTGANPIQTGVAPGTIDSKRAAVLRGKVIDRGGAALTGARITIVGHPEFGQTLSRADGMFDMAANGGGQLTVRYEKAGYLPVQRQVPVAWQDFTVLPDVVMLTRDPQVTTIQFAANTTTMQIARGSVQSDSDGTRRATVMFPAGTTAALVQPDGSTVPASTLSIRLTEYTVGPNGQKAMPGLLPPTSGYTYAVELGADEAVAKVNGRDVVFNQPVILYVENFLDIPVGAIVPVGYYDPTRSTWVGANNGFVVKIVSITGGLANLDIDGDGVADGPAALAAAGITNAERQQLANLYPVGTTLWRSTMDHFSTFDCNWSIICIPFDCGPPHEFLPLKPPPNQCTEAGWSLIGCEKQTLGEQIWITGTPFTLNYQSDRVPGRTAERGQVLSLASKGLPNGVQSTELEILVAGQKLIQHLPANTGTTSFVWDGNDAYGRPLQGSHPFTVRIGYTYKVITTVATLVPSAWARFSGIPFSGSRARGELTLWQELPGVITRQDQRAFGLGGWSLSALHSYDPQGHALNLGDGTRIEANTNGDVVSGSVLTTVAGDGGSTFNGDGMPATQASLPSNQGMAVGPDGSIYFADNQIHTVRRIGPDGIINTIAGTGTQGFSGDGGPGTQAQLAFPANVAVGLDGSVYISDRNNHRVRRVRPDGTIVTFAGTGAFGGATDGQLATQAPITPNWVAVGPDGSVYISESNRIWVVDQNGVIKSYAGGLNIQIGDNGPALQARLDNASAMSFAPDGTLFFIDGTDIRKVTPQGIITRVAGNGLGSYSGDGGPALSAGLGNPIDIAAARDGSFYIGIFFNRVRRVGPDGVITTVVGTGAPGFSGDHILATQTNISPPAGLAIGPSNELYISDRNRRILRLAPALPGGSPTDILIPSTDGDQVYVFTSEGRHLRTLNGLTGATLLQFTYDPAGYPIAITDADNNVTTIERNGSIPIAIVAPGGQRTSLTTDANGWLTQISDPANQSQLTQHSPTGLLSTLTDPRGNIHTFTYDAVGRLIKDEDPAGGSLSIARTEQTNGFTVAATTALGRTRTYQVEQLDNGGLRRTLTNADGTQVVNVAGVDGSSQSTYNDGTVVTVQYGADPRWGMLAPVIAKYVIAMPSGLTGTWTASRTATLADAANPFSITQASYSASSNGHAGTSVYTGAQKKFTTTTPAGRSGTTTIDTVGRTTTEQFGTLASTSYTYNAQGLLTTIATGAGTPRTATLAYNAERNPTTVTDPISGVTTFVYDAAQRPVGTTLQDGRQIGAVYDANGNVTSITPPGRPNHAFAYTVVDLEAQYDPPAVPGVQPDVTATTYDADHERTLVTRPDGRTLAMTYDTGGRLSSVAFSRGTLAMTYAPSGVPANLTAPDGFAHAFTFDGPLLVSHQLSGPVSGLIAWTYNSDFRVASESVDGGAVAFTYDLDGLLTGAGSLTLARTSAGLISGTTLNTLADTLTYNSFAEALDYRASAGTTQIYRMQFTRDALGRITQKVETILGVVDTYTYGYDAAGRLTSATRNGSTASYTYDANSNRISYSGSFGNVPAAQVSVDAQDRMMQYGTNAYAYAANGEVVSRTTGALVTTYAYDEFGNLTGAALANGTVIEYLIDGMHRRVGKKVNGTPVRRWLWDGHLRIVAEQDGNGALISRFVYATRANVPDYVVRGATTYRLITDHLGSPRLLVNSVTGAVAGTMNHDEFGRVTVDTLSSLIPFGYAGGLYDSDTGLVRFGYRDYDAETGRWTAKDPLLFGGGDPNVYAYASNDPINFIDPSGLQDEAPRANLMNAISPKGDDGALRSAANNVQGSHSVFDVAIHSRRNSFLLNGKSTSDVNKLVDAVVNSSEWKEYIKTRTSPRMQVGIRLLACNSGNDATPVNWAKRFADAIRARTGLDIDVAAPSGKLRLVAGPGETAHFIQGKNPHWNVYP